ncbi:TIGR03857 family LLM class F420-dependent oxidoreductase [Sporichthya sp.]|uniref:TIGR03857 family LLM class F420-dependent oxidoreductase n=1 Tax=Sporichthya sp. TaxID=65475 RepID=UPI00182EE8A8|nr:TIGR03857 family LLM class F420-dependent oxidoreductase [Sporichthya sp.]MBA3742921.1 TIGR03857 family LLM class F420-dependent oxidoreductase [Sporichthya sp.]
MSTLSPQALVPDAGLAPEAEDISLYVRGGRLRSSAEVVPDAVEAERIGISRLWLSERYDLKEAGVLLGGMAARTTRLKLGTAALFPGSRNVLLTAALGSTMHSAFGPRFTLGLGRSMSAYIQNANLTEISYAALADYPDLLRRIWRGEDIDYDGPVGSFRGLHMADTYPGPAPEIYSVNLGGPRASRVTATAGFDGVYLQPFMTAEAVDNTKIYLQKACEEIGRDPASIRIVVPMISAPELDDERARAYMHARMVTYLGQPGLAEAYERINRWDAKLADPVRNHPMLAHDPDRVDHNFHRDQLMEVANLVPDEWMYSTSLAGSLDDCVAKMAAYKAAGADEICFYGSTAAENASLVAAWRDR